MWPDVVHSASSAFAKLGIGAHGSEGSQVLRLSRSPVFQGVRASDLKAPAYLRVKVSLFPHENDNQDNRRGGVHPCILATAFFLSVD